MGILKIVFNFTSRNPNTFFI